MTHHPAPKQHTPVPESKTQPAQERDTLNDTPELRFLRDEIEALLGAPSVRRAMRAPSIGYSDHDNALAEEQKETQASTADDDSDLELSIYDRDTEPSVDAMLLREAVRAAGK